MNKQIFVDLTTAFDAAEKDDNVRCVVVNAEAAPSAPAAHPREMKGLDNPEAVFDYHNVAGIFMKKMISFVKPTITRGPWRHRRRRTSCCWPATSPGL